MQKVGIDTGALDDIRLDGCEHTNLRPIKLDDPMKLVIIDRSPPPFLPRHPSQGSFCDADITSRIRTILGPGSLVDTQKQRGYHDTMADNCPDQAFGGMYFVHHRHN